jgi:hypothetical protein
MEVSAMSERRKNVYGRKINVDYRQSILNDFFWCVPCGKPTNHFISQREYSGDVDGLSQMRRCLDCENEYRFDFLRGKDLEEAIKKGHLSWE